MKTKLLALFLALVASVGIAFASNTQVDGIWYNFDSNTLTAEVTYRGSSYDEYSREYSGVVTIPTYVNYGGQIYYVTSIGESAFEWCSSLTSVTIPNSVTSIGEGAFEWCSSLTKVNISDLTAWCNISFSSSYSNPLCYAKRLFLNDEEITDLVIPNSITCIGKYAFYNCSSLTSVTIPNSVTSIGTEAFRGCCSLTSVTIPNSVTSIGYAAFKYCSGLISVTIPNSVTSIGNNAFSDCSSLISVTIPNSVISIEDYAFYGCCSLTSVTIPNSVTSIGGSAFRDCSSLTSVTIPNSITSIGKDAFSGCSNLTSVTIPNSVTSIGERAFQGCSSLTSVTIPNSVTSIGGNAFYNCSSLTSPLYNAHVFAYMPTSYSGAYTIPNGIESIAGAAFAECSEMTSVTIPNSVTSIGMGAFGNCSSLTSVSIPNSVTNIGGSAFEGCNGLTSVVIGHGVTNFEDDVFRDCSSLTSVVWKAKNVKDFTMYNTPFYHCYMCEYYSSWHPAELTLYDIRGQITSFVFGDKVEVIPAYLCSGMYKLTSIKIPNSVTSIETGAFNGCRRLASIDIPNNVTAIKQDAFAGCYGLKEVVLGAKLKVIESGAFCNSSSIETIKCYSMRPPTATIADSQGQGSFSKDMPYSTIIYVPAACLNTYKMHDFWGMYDVRPIGAATSETTSVQVTPSETTATVAWPTINGAETYEMVIKDKQGNVICTLTFNSNGQLTEIAFNAPARNDAIEQTQASGFSFTVTGLEEGTAYELTITSKDSNGTTLDKKTIAFSTAGGTGVADILSDKTPSTKLIRDGKVLILRGDKAYTVQGQEVR